MQRFPPGSSSQPTGSINFEVDMFPRQLSLGLSELQIRYLEDTYTTAKRQLKELEDA